MLNDEIPNLSIIAEQKRQSIRFNDDAAARYISGFVLRTLPKSIAKKSEKCSSGAQKPDEEEKHAAD